MGNLNKFQAATKTLDDPDWNTALQNFQGHTFRHNQWEYLGVSDGKLMSELFSSNAEIPAFVRREIAKMLDPKSKGLRGKISVTFPKKRDFGYYEMQFNDILRIRADYKMLRDKGWPYEAAVLELMKLPPRYKRTVIAKIVAMTDRDLEDWSKQRKG
jgi:hypothetical protein